VIFTWLVIIECPNDIALGLCSMCMCDFMLSPSIDSDELESKLDGGPPTIFSHPSPIPVGLRLPDILRKEEKTNKTLKWRWLNACQCGMRANICKTCFKQLLCDIHFKLCRNLFWIPIYWLIVGGSNIFNIRKCIHIKILYKVP